MNQIILNIKVKVQSFLFCTWTGKRLTCSDSQVDSGGLWLRQGRDGGDTYDCDITAWSQSKGACRVIEVNAESAVCGVVLRVSPSLV